MRTIKAVLSGFLVASALILAAGWAYGLLAAPEMRGEYYRSSLLTALPALVYTSASIVAGAFVASRIHDSSETISGFSVAQAFFGFGLIREFWSTGCDSVRNLRTRTTAFCRQTKDGWQTILGESTRCVGDIEET